MVLRAWLLWRGLSPTLVGASRRAWLGLPGWGCLAGLAVGLITGVRRGAVGFAGVGAWLCLGESLRDAVAMCLPGPDGRWLVMRRALDDRGGGQVGFPAGKVDVGESQEDACRREGREELGVELVPVSCFAVVDLPVLGVRLHAWLVDALSLDFQPDPVEWLSCFGLRALSCPLIRMLWMLLRFWLPSCLWWMRVRVGVRLVCRVVAGLVRRLGLEGFDWWARRWVVLLTACSKT